MNELAAQIRAEQRRQWQAGRRVPIEVYLEQHPSVRAHPDVTLDLIYSEVLLREEFGESVCVEEYLRRFPPLVAALRRQLELHLALRAGLRSGSDVHNQATDVHEETDRHLSCPETSGLGPRPRSDVSPTELPAVPGYEVLRPIGTGARGVVYEARQLGLNRLVALKMIRDGDDAKAMALFRREAEAVARLRHPNIVQVHEFGACNGRPYFTMELAENGCLEQQLARGPLPPREAAALVETLAQALHAVHQEKIVHRDLKPANILLTKDGTPKVADFGLAKDLEGDVSLLPSGAIVGTAAYMAPEQARGKTREVGPAADTYALGAILHAALTGRPPFTGATWWDTLHQVRTQPPAPLPRDRVPPPLADVCRKCLEKAPARRYASALELAADLRRFLDGTPVQARQTWRGRARQVLGSPAFVGAAAVLVLLAAAGAFLARPRPDPEDQILTPREQAEAVLSQGAPFVFEGPEPLPGPFRWAFGETGPIHTDAAEGCFAFAALWASLLELVADPGCDRYRFSAEVRHDDSTDMSDVGLYFGFRSGLTPAGARQVGFFTLSFADRGNHVRVRSKSNPEEGGRALLHFNIGERPDWVYRPHVSSPRRFRAALPLAGPGLWRKLAVEVTPGEVRAFWRNETGVDELFATVTTKYMEDKVLNSMDAEMPSVPVAFNPRAGLGLYVCRAKAAFRRIEVRPLPAGP